MGVDWFLYRLQEHGLSVIVSISSVLILHCCKQMLDEPHSKKKKVHVNYNCINNKYTYVYTQFTKE